MQPQRLFIALDFSPQIIQAITKVLQFFINEKLSGVNWVKPQNLHLTLRFLGDTLPHQREQIDHFLSTECLKISPFSVTVEKSGVFPNFKRPRVLWVGITVPNELLLLQAKIELGCRTIGFKPEDKPFNPHLTIGRVSQFATNQEIETISKTLYEYEVNHLGSCMIDHLTLFKSDLQRTGSVYTVLNKYPLRKE
jgi:RNA 2',3'-cyclic 3'-phosphodiesterase